MTALRQRMLGDMQIRNLSPLTQRAYVEHVSRFSRHFERSPAMLGPEQIRAYLLYLTTEKQLALRSIIVAVDRGPRLPSNGHDCGKVGSAGASRNS